MKSRSSLRVHDASLVELRSLRLAEIPPPMAQIFRVLAVGLVLVVLCLVFVPWQQTVRGSGRIVAYSPTEREQSLQAPVDGRIVNWYVVEGSVVRAGDAIVDMVDVDPDYVARLEIRLQAERDRIKAAQERIAVYIKQQEAYDRARELKVKAAKLNVTMAVQKLNAEKQRLSAATAALDTAERNLKRTIQLHEKGIASSRQLELDELAVTKALTDMNSAGAQVSEAEAARTALEAEVLRADAEGGARVATARAEVEKALSEEAYARGDLAKVEVELSRQLARAVVAPVDGTIVHIDGNVGGGMVKSGQTLALLVPDTQSRAVELFIRGNDAPLVGAGSKVRLQFEGWPAVQFVGWPSTAIGTFGGRVSFVDPAAMDEMGRVRVLIQPDPEDTPWPEANLLRQQVRANGWMLLNRVSLGWEIWRLINGFPPALTQGLEQKSTPLSGPAQTKRKRPI